MSNPVIGHITCPHCSNEMATVHRESRGKKALYYRCYDGSQGECGTVQVRGSGGQRFIMENMRALNPEQKAEVAVDNAMEAEEAAQKAIAAEEKKAAKKSPLGMLWSVEE